VLSRLIHQLVYLAPVPPAYGDEQQECDERAGDEE